MTLRIERIFLGWHRPLCETVPERLLQRGGMGMIDSRDTVVVLPTRQASWRLRTALPLAAHERYGAALIGPEIVTAPVLIAPPPRAGRASDFQALLAWCTVLRETPPGELDVFLGKQRPGSNVWALQIARRLIRLRRELADGALTITDVANGGKAADEAERWQAMANLEQRYLDRLKSWNLRDAISDQLAHAAAGKLPPHVKRVVLAAIPDPPRLLLELLTVWSENGGSVTVLVAAPESEAAAFDNWGRPLPDVWTQREVALDDRDLILAADPEDQARRIAELLKTGLMKPLDGTRDQRPSVAIGVPDRETVAPLQRELAARNMPAFDPRNRVFGETPLFRLAQALLDWNERPGYAETAAVLRHPHVLAALNDGDQVLCGLDTVQSEKLPVTFDQLCKAAEDWTDPRRDPNNAIDALRAALTWLTVCRRELRGQPLSDGLRAALKAVYDQRRLQPRNTKDKAFQQAAGSLDAALRELAEAEAAGQTGTDTAAVLLARLQGMPIKPERAGEPLDLEGWLELAWNPAPVLFVAGMNEGFVPDSQVGDLFLPDTLRRDLELRDDRLRVARDSYLLTALCAQRSTPGDGPPQRVVLLVGKRATAGDPLRPSRLLFRCPDELLVQRARRLFRDPPPAHTAAAHEMSFTLDPNRVPTGIITRRLLERISPTAFRTYLACPFRFYLQRILGMETADDRAREPDARGFGDLCHEVLERMGRNQNKIWACGDAVVLGDWLDRCLRETAAARYGDSPWLGVTLAVEAAANRLRDFARQQTEWHAQGWEIIETEVRIYQTILQGVTIGGQIDRIDRHRHTGAICVWDYKTTDKATTPIQTHMGSVGDATFLPEAVLSAATIKSLGIGGTKATPKRWLDLQLPLYREMARATYGPAVGIGYILLPAALGETAFAPWDGYHDELHDHALNCARAVVSRIRAGAFWPPAPKSPKYDDFTDLILDDPEKTFVAPPNPWSVS